MTIAEMMSQRDLLKLGQLIEQLQQLEREHGADLPVLVNHGCQGLVYVYKTDVSVGARDPGSVGQADDPEKRVEIWVDGTKPGIWIGEYKPFAED
jgi:hypothetical protein